MKLEDKQDERPLSVMVLTEWVLVPEAGLSLAGRKLPPRKRGGRFSGGSSSPTGRRTE